MSDTPLAKREDVLRRLEDEPTDRMLTMIDEAIDDASDLARFHGDDSWGEDSVPAKVRRIVAAAAARWIRNPDSYTTSRAADETLAWGEVDEPGAVSFTKSEIAQLQKLAPVKMAGFGSFGVAAWGGRSRVHEEYVPWGHDGESFPYVYVQHPLGPRR